MTRRDLKELEHDLPTHLPAGAAVPNDLSLVWEGPRAAVLSGPNMGGKSCLVRMAALMVIMAQVRARARLCTRPLHHPSHWVAL